MHFRIAAGARYHRLGFVGTPHAHAQNVLPLPFLHFLQRRGADHPAVGNDADRADAEAAFQPLHDGNQTLHVGGVARPEFAADRIAVLIQYYAHNHLLQIGTMIFRMATLADRLAPLALEVDGSGVEEHQIQTGEQVPALREQFLLNQLLGSARHEGRSPVLLIFRQNSSQPSHGPVEMVQTQLAEAFDGVVVFPLLGGTVAARREEAMQHGEEDGPLDGKLEAAALQPSGQGLADRAGFPQTLEDHCRTDPGASSGDALTASMSAENRQLFREPPERLDERIEFAGSQKFIETTEAEQDALLNLAVDAHIIDDQEISSGTVGLSANEQSGAPMSPSWPRIQSNNKCQMRFCANRRDTTFSHWRPSLYAESTSYDHFS